METSQTKVPRTRFGICSYCGHKIALQVIEVPSSLLPYEVVISDHKPNTYLTASALCFGSRRNPASLILEWNQNPSMPHAAQA